MSRSYKKHPYTKDGGPTRLKFAKPQLKQEWSKEDKDVIDEAAELALGWGCPNLSAKLKSILSRVKPAEWSEEDEKKLERVDDLLWMLDDYISDDCSICEERTARLRDEIQKELCPWLKSLRPWKPNVEKLYYDRVNKEFYVKETINDPKSAIQELYKRLNKQ